MDFLPDYCAVCSFLSIRFNVLFCLAFSCALSCLLACQTSFLRFTIVGLLVWVFLPNCFTASWSIIILSFISLYWKCCKPHFPRQIHCSVKSSFVLNRFIAGWSNPHLFFHVVSMLHLHFHCLLIVGQHVSW